MNWSAIVAAVALLASAVSGWLALSMRAERAERRAEIEELRTEHEKTRANYERERANEFQQLRNDINGSYMRANEVRAIIERVETSVHAVADRVTLMERK